jgi:hypothetical protein
VGVGRGREVDVAGMLVAEGGIAEGAGWMAQLEMKKTNSRLDMREGCFVFVIMDGLIRCDKDILI